MKKKILIYLLITVCLISIALTALVYSFYRVDYVQEFDMSIIIGDHIGIDAGSDKLSFGMVPPGGTSVERKINIQNSRNYPLKVNVKKYGDIKGWVSVSPNSFIINQNEDKQVAFNAKTPQSIEYGTYTGKVRFYFLKV